MDPKSVKEFPERHTDRKRKVDHIGKSLQEKPTNVSSATVIKNGDGTSIWDNNFPFGDFIDNHLMTEKDHENLPVHDNFPFGDFIDNFLNHRPRTIS
jgi:hypothetical protein